MIKNKSKRNFVSVGKKNRLKPDFTTELGGVRRCTYCKSYMKYSKRCAQGNKPSSKFICYRFVLKAGLEEDYKNFLLDIKNKSKGNSNKKKRINK